MFCSVELIFLSSLQESKRVKERRRSRSQGSIELIVETKKFLINFHTCLNSASSISLQTNFRQVQAFFDVSINLMESSIGINTLNRKFKSSFLFELRRTNKHNI